MPSLLYFLPTLHAQLGKFRQLGALYLIERSTLCRGDDAFVAFPRGVAIF
jgi:hypothetical protein